MEELFRTFLNMRVKTHGGDFLPNKPLLLLIALTRCQQGKERLASFLTYEETLLLFSREFGVLNAVFPFGRLCSDGVWEIPGNSELCRNSSGDFIRSELIDKSVLGGFPENVYKLLAADSALLEGIGIKLLEKYIPYSKHANVLSILGLLLVNLTRVNEQDERLADVSIQREKMDRIEQGDVVDKIGDNTSGFISYLNSLHNLGASGANALAESQALNSYFGELYTPFPLIHNLAHFLTDGVPRVVILTGHAGDGKSTVALDVLKKLRHFPPTAPLGQPMSTREDIVTPSGQVSIIKDMSELSAECRRDWLNHAFKESGSWLIISNTGPLLSSLTDYALSEGLDPAIESLILDRLDRPLDNAHLGTHTLDGFGKELVILNLTRWNNLELVDGILTRLVNHSGWGQCAACSVESACPLMLNRKALRDSGSVAGERVRWIYQRLSAYEQRLTLRQIVAQLAFGLTGGMSCSEARQRVEASTAEGPDRGSIGLEKILFSECFFGYCGGRLWPAAERLHAVELVRRATFGAPVGVDYERRLPTEAGIGWATLPPSLNWLGNHWRQRAAESAGVNWRFALRRMVYIFGAMAPGRDDSASVFLDSFVQSPSLRELDRWQVAGKLTVTYAQVNRLRTSCLRVLLEVFSGFNPRQFKQSHSALYLTLRRPDRAVVQPTQLVIETLQFQDFDLRFDPVRGLLVLSYDKGRAELALTLPLLDYIRRRDAGELGNALAPIHQGQLDCFRAELLRVTAESRKGQDDIVLLRAGIDGEVQVHRFLLDRDKNVLEQG